MKTLLSSLVAAMLIMPATSCGETITASKNYVTRTIKVPAFTAIATSSFIDVEYTQGAVQNVTLTASDNIIDYVDISVRNGELNVSFKGNGHRKFILTSKKVVVTVSAPAVNRFSASSSGDIEIKSTLNIKGKVTFNSQSSGDIDAVTVKCDEMTAFTSSSGDIKIEALNCTTLQAKTSSAGDISIGNIVARDVKASASSSGDIKLNGRCTNAVYECSSAGDIKARGLIAVNVDASASSAGDIDCTATGNVNTSKSSAGSVKVNRK